MDAIEKDGSARLHRIYLILKGFAHFVEHLTGVERAAIDANERCFWGAGQPVDQAGVDALAGTTLADQENRDVRGGDFRGKDVQRLKVRALAVNEGGVGSPSDGLSSHISDGFPENEKSRHGAKRRLGPSTAKISYIADYIGLR